MIVVRIRTRHVLNGAIEIKLGFNSLRNATCEKCIQKILTSPFLKQPTSYREFWRVNYPVESRLPFII